MFPEEKKFLVGCDYLSSFFCNPENKPTSSQLNDRLKSVSMAERRGWQGRRSSCTEMNSPNEWSCSKVFPLFLTLEVEKGLSANRSPLSLSQVLFDRNKLSLPKT